MERRSLQYTDAKSDKFWTITLEGKSHTVQYGRVGTTGQSQTKEFGSEAEAQKSFQKLLQEKLKKGYVEIESINAAAQTDVQRSTVQCQEDTVPQPSARPESKQDVYAALQTQLTQNKKELCELAALDAIPDAFIPLLDLEIKVAIAEQSNSSPRILEYLVNDAHDTVRQTLARNTDLPTHLLEKLAEDKNRSVRLSLASNGNAPSDALAKLINDPYEDIRRKVLDHANTPKPNKQIFTSIINHASPHERQYFSVLRGLASQRASDWISSLRFYQSFYENNPATDLNTPQTTLESLSEHPDASMRTAVAQNPSCPESLLRKLAKDPYTVSHNEYSGVGAYVIRKQVQEAVAINAHVPVDLLAEFVQTRNLFLFLAVAHNPCCPSELLEAMAQEQDLLYPCSSGSPRHQSLYLQDLKLEIAHHPNTPIHVLEEIAKYTAPKTDIAHLRHKLYGTSKYVSQAAQANYRCQYAGIAKNPDTPTNQIQKMTKHRDSWVRVIAAQNAQGLQFLLSNHLKDKLSLTRLLVIMHRAIPISTIQELSVSNAWHDRYAVTQNPSTPTEILQQLVQDAEPIVQNAAKTALGLEVFVAQPMAQAEVAQVLKQAKPVERDPNTSEQPAVLEKLEIVRSLNLKPEDWLWATWQPLNPKHRNSIQPFDKEQCVKQLQRIPCTTRGYFDVQWDKANLPVLMSREEANFWLSAMMCDLTEPTKSEARFGKTDRTDLAKSLQNQDFSAKPNLNQVCAAFLRDYRKIRPTIVFPLFNLFNFAEFCTAIANFQQMSTDVAVQYLITHLSESYIEKYVADRHWLTRKDSLNALAHVMQREARYPFMMLVHGFRDHLWPFLSDQEIQLLVEQLRPALKILPTSLPLHTLAAYFGMEDVRTYLDNLKLNSQNQYVSPVEAIEIIFGAGDAKLVESYARSLNLVLTKFVFSFIGSRTGITPSIKRRGQKQIA